MCRPKLRYDRKAELSLQAVTLFRAVTKKKKAFLKRHKHETYATDCKERAEILSC
jgi:hypothetical protein